ncbi:MAG TPA: hypothetical protein VM925_08660 [Labilithrix sp.]|nr:hypothetical protein [Labilithrix sp.]
MDTTTADTTTDAAGPWGCLGKVPALPAEDPNTPVHHVRRFVGLLDLKPLSEVPVRACVPSGVECLELAGSPKATDANGTVDVLLYRGFRGFLDIAAPAKGPDLVPGRIYLGPDDEASKSGVPPWPSAIPTKSELEFSAASAGKQIRPEYGHLFFLSLDCQHKAAANTVARVEPIAADTFTFYVDSAGTPSLTQAKTSSTGVGAFVNLPVGGISVTFSRDDGTRIGERTVIIRAGAITYLPLAPTP